MLRRLDLPSPSAQKPPTQHTCGSQLSALVPVPHVFVDCSHTCRLMELLERQTAGWHAAGGLRLSATHLTAWKAVEAGRPRTLRSTAATRFQATLPSPADRAAIARSSLPSRGTGSAGISSGSGGAERAAQRAQRPAAQPAPAVSAAGSVVASAPGPVATSSRSMQHLHAQQGGAVRQPAAAAAQPVSRWNAASQDTLPASQLAAHMQDTQQSQAAPPRQRMQYMPPPPALTQQTQQQSPVSEASSDHLQVPAPSMQLQGFMYSHCSIFIFSAMIRSALMPCAKCKE